MNLCVCKSNGFCATWTSLTSWTCYMHISPVIYHTMCCKHAAALQGAPEIAKLHFVELAAPPSKQARGREGPKGGLAQAQALSKAYSSLTSVLLALKQQRRKQDQEVPRSDHSTHISASLNFNAAKLAMIPFRLRKHRHAARHRH